MKQNVLDALNSARDTKTLLLGRGVLFGLPSLYLDNFGSQKAIVVCDATTYRLLGKRVCEILRLGGVDCVNSFVFDEPHPYADFDHMLRLESVLAESGAVAIPVGSGTLNDLSKLASGRLNRPYMCVATAASMDGYTAYGASITHNGSKQTFACPAPRAVLADVDVIRRAPSAMTASGYADLFAKITAGADWILADALGVELIDAASWSIVQGGLKSALSDPKGAANGSPESVEALIEGLLLGGFAMQWLQSSRPASGAEHQFSHLWNMEHHVHDGEAPSHGFQVGVATLYVARLYDRLLDSSFVDLDVAECCVQWPSWPDMEKRIISMFGGTDFLETAIAQSKSKYIAAEQLATQLDRLKREWPVLRERLKAQLLPSAEVERRLKLVGAPTSPIQIGITADRMKRSFVRAHYIRSRFTILDLAMRIGHLNQWLDEIFD